MKYIVIPLLKFLGCSCLFIVALLIVVSRIIRMILYSLWTLKYWNAFEGPFYNDHGNYSDYSDVAYTFWDFVTFNWVEVPDNDE